MKKNCCVICCILLLLFINGCAMNDTAVNHDFGVISDVSEVSEEENGHEEKPLPDVRSEADVSEEVAAPESEGKQDAKSMDPVEKRMLLYGGCGTLGCGWLLYTVPDQEDQDYKIYFFADKSKDCKGRFKSFEEMDNNLDQADFI